MRTLVSLRSRLLAGAALWIAAALLVAWFWIGDLLRGTLEHAFDQRLEATLTALLATVEAASDGSVARWPSCMPGAPPPLSTTRRPSSSRRWCR